MGSKRKVFLYKLVTGKTIEFDSQTSAGVLIRISTPKRSPFYSFFSSSLVFYLSRMVFNIEKEHKKGT